LDEGRATISRILVFVYGRQDAVGGVICGESFSETLPFGPILIGEDEFIFSLCHLAYSSQNFSSMFARARVAKASDGNWWREDK